MVRVTELEDALRVPLDAQRKTDIFGMTMVGLVIAGIGLLVIWLVGHGIARPLKQMVAMLNDIAQGEGDLTRRLTSDRADELGAIAAGFNTFLIKLLERRRIKLRNELKYTKIMDSNFSRGIESKIMSYTQNHLNAIVINFVDMIAHSRSDNAILKEIAPDESAYRSLTASWFEHSSFFGMLRQLSTRKDVKIIITTDHGSIRCLHGVKAMGDRETSTNLRYKCGRNVKSDSRK